MYLTEKQTEYLRSAHCRWNFKVGAARSGKTFCDLFTVPMRIRSCDRGGSVVLIGYTVGTLCRNLLDPMRRFWGDGLVGGASGKSDSVMLFGRLCYLLGADKVNQVERLQGMSIAYCYGDEVTTWNEEVFQMLKSRLDRPGACFDGTCNPSHPTHWLKRFLDSDADIYLQTYVMDDNPHLPVAFVTSLKQEYAGSIWYDRLILGRWVAAEGVIYREFADSPSVFHLGAEEMASRRLIRIAIGVDFGGTRSGTAFAAMGYTAGYREAIALRSERFLGEIDTERLNERFLSFARSLFAQYRLPMTAYCDSAEPILIRSLRLAAAEDGMPIRIRKARKGPIRDRIRLTLSLMSRGRFFLTGQTETLACALQNAVWDAREMKDTRLDDGTSDIDSLDAMEYAMEHFSASLLSAGGEQRRGA